MSALPSLFMGVGRWLVDGQALKLLLGVESLSSSVTCYGISRGGLGKEILEVSSGMFNGDPEFPPPPSLCS